MDWWAWILLVLAVLVLAAWVSNLRMEMHYSRVGENDRFYVYVHGLYGLVRYKYDIPMIKFKGLYQGIDLKTEHVNELNSNLMGEHYNNIDREKILKYYRKFKEILKATLDMKEWIKDTMAQFCCTDMKWITKVGVGDAPETAITTGLVWTVKSSILAYMFKYIHRDVKPDVRVIPMYNQTFFSTELSCIAQIRLGQAIFAGLHLLVRIMKVKGGIKAWQNILSKAS
jgi:hypothetical protein